MSKVIEEIILFRNSFPDVAIWCDVLLDEVYYSVHVCMMFESIFIGLAYVFGKILSSLVNFMFYI